MRASAIVLVSDDERFRNVSRSLAIVESVLERTSAFTGPRETPITIFRASNEDDAQTARVAADGLKLRRARLRLRGDREPS